MSNTKNNAKTCTAEELYFPVEMIDNPTPTNSEYSKIVRGVIEEEVWDLNYCSDKYELIANEDIFPSIESVLDNSKIEYDVTYKHINNVRFYADYQITDKRFAYTMEGTNDKIEPMLRVQHSYNGMTKYRIMFGYFRLVCSNGLVIPLEEMKEHNLEITGKHTAQIVHSFQKLDDMLNTFATELGNIGEIITEKYETLSGSAVLNPKDRLKEILAASKITAVENSNFNTVDDIMSRVSVEANSDILGYGGEINNWLLYNGINAYLNDDSRYASAPETRIKNDRDVFEYILKTA